MSVTSVNITLLEKIAWAHIFGQCIKKLGRTNVTFVVWHFSPEETKSNIWKNIHKICDKNLSQICDIYSMDGGYRKTSLEFVTKFVTNVTFVVWS